jgi:hypothetical protein
MRFSSLFVASRVIAILSIAGCGLSGTAMALPATLSGGATTALPDVVVEAPKQAARPQNPKQRAVAHSTGSPRTSPTAPTPSASPVLPTAQLTKLANAAGSCVGGCVTSFRSGTAPWVGCSWSAGTYSSTCRNVGNYKTYVECTEAGRITGWRVAETSWYCTSLALK